MLEEGLLRRPGIVGEAVPKLAPGAGGSEWAEVRPVEIALTWENNVPRQTGLSRYLGYTVRNGRGTQL